MTDPSGAAVAGAAVVLVHLATNATISVASTSSGEYSAPNLSPGVYRVEITAAGFKHFLQDNVTLVAAGTVRLDAQLQVGQVSETVEVTASVAQLQTENAKITTARCRTSWWTSCRWWWAARCAVPSTWFPWRRRPKARTTAWRWAEDRRRPGTPPSMDSRSLPTAPPMPRKSRTTLSQWRPLRSSLWTPTALRPSTARPGRGGVMTFVSKSGTNDLHGPAYDFVRNDQFDARGLFAGQRSVYKQHDFGVTGGGPVWLPKLYNGRNRTFFFLSYEGFRNRVGANDTILSVPTPEMYQGDFSKWVDSANRLLQIYDPVTTRPNPSGSGSVRDPLPGNQLPQARFSSFSKQLITYGAAVKPNRTGAVPGAIDHVRNNYPSRPIRKAQNFVRTES